MSYDKEYQFLYSIKKNHPMGGFSNYINFSDFPAFMVDNVMVATEELHHHNVVHSWEDDS